MPYGRKKGSIDPDIALRDAKVQNNILRDIRAGHRQKDAAGRAGIRPIELKNFLQVDDDFRTRIYKARTHKVAKLIEKARDMAMNGDLNALKWLFERMDEDTNTAEQNDLRFAVSMLRDILSERNELNEQD